MSAPTAIERLLHRGAMYRVCGIALGYPGPGRLAKVAELASQASAFADAQIRTKLSALAEAIPSTEDGAVAAQYVALFDGAAACAPYEGAYGPPQMAGKSAQLADIAGFYLAFGLEPATGQPDVEDHIATEFEFMSVLAVKEAWALAEGHHEHAEITHDAAASFLTDHVGRWATAFARELSRMSALPYYRAVADLVSAWVTAEVAALGLTVSPLAPAPVDCEAGEDFACPMAER